MDIIEKLNWRYATKRFDPNQKLSEKKLQTILEAGRLAASSFGLQPARLVVITDPKRRQSLEEKNSNQPQVVEASHLIVVCRVAQMDNNYVDTYVDHVAKTRGRDRASLTGYANMMKEFLNGMTEDQRNCWMEKQVYITLGTLLTTCAVLDIDACPMEGFDRKGYDEILSLPERGLCSVVLCPVGYRSVEDNYAKQKKVRFSLNEFVVKI